VEDDPLAQGLTRRLLDGHSLSCEATRMRPGLAVVLMSGYTADVFAGSAEGGPGVAFLQKPFGQAELAEKVRAALDARVTC
jgi:two-component system, cell cycle sensor histidine kinase and response regulator CckA